MAIKAKELALKIGVSEATLSLVLNHKEGISKKTREMVTEKIMSMGYGYMFKNNSENSAAGQAQKIGGSLKEQGSIALVVYKDTGIFMDNSPFFPLIIDGMEMTARKNGYKLMVINVRRDMALSEKLEYIRDSGCAGYVVDAPELPEEEVDALMSLKIPFVLLDNYFPEKNVDCVTLNNEQGIYIILKQLIGLGHRKIGYLGSGVKIQSFRERQSAFRKLMNEWELPISEKFFVDIGYPGQEAMEGMEKLIQNKTDLPTAFITDNDFVAYGAIKALQKAGYDVPKDVSVIGFSDRPVCMYIEPNIATMKIPRLRFGGEAVDLLINKIIHKPFEEHSVVRVLLNMELIMRPSVGFAKE